MSAMWRPAGDFAVEALAVTQLRTEFPDLIGLRTGIPALDDALRGELEPGHVIIVAGSSGSGKTALAAQIGAQFATQVPTFVISLEDDPLDVANRQLANISNENVRDIRTGFLAGEVPDTVLEAVGTMQGLMMDINDGIVAPRVEHLAVIIGEWAKSKGEQRQLAVIVDQLSHISPSRASDKFWSYFPNVPQPPAASAASHEMLEWQVLYLQTVAKKYGITMVIVHQLNDKRDEASKKPDLSSIRGSRGIVHKADAVLVPWIPKQVENLFAGVGDAKFAPNDSKTGEILLLKGRHVELVDTPVQFDGARQRFVPIELGAQARWAPTPAKSAKQIEGGSKLAALFAEFDALAEERYAIPKRALPVASVVIEATVVEEAEADDGLWFPDADDVQIENTDPDEKAS